MTEEKISELDAQSYKQSIGKTLREARESCGLTIEDVAQKTKFGVKQIADLENNFLSLDGSKAIYHRGLVKSYAKMVNIAPESLLGAPEAIVVGSAFSSTHSIDVPFNEHHFFSRSNKIWLYAGLVIAAAAISLTAWHLLKPAERNQEVAGGGATLEAEMELPIDFVEENIQVEQAGIPTTLSAFGQDDPVQESSVSQSDNSNAIVNDTIVETVRQNNDVKPADELAVTSDLPQTNGESELHFVFADRSWVRVADYQGQVLDAQLHEAGTEFSVKGNKPFSIVIGNAGSVTLYEAGKQVDLSAVSGTQVARLKIE